MTRPGLLSWFGLLGPGFAWAGMHVSGYALTEAACSKVNADGGLHLNAWTAVVMVIAAAIAVAGEVAAVVAWRATRSASDDELPGSRIQFVAVMAMAFSPLFLAIILMSGLGVLFLPECIQG